VVREHRKTDTKQHEPMWIPEELTEIILEYLNDGLAGLELTQTFICTNYRPDLDWDECVKRGSLEGIIRLNPKYDLVLQNVLDRAAKKGWIRIVSYLVETGLPCMTYVATCAAANGHLHVFEYLSNAKIYISTDALVLARRNGHPDVVRFIRSKHPNLNDCSVWYACEAARSQRRVTCEVIIYKYNS